MDPIVIKTASEDNVGIVANSEGLKAGTILDDGTSLSQNIPMGHKVALSRINEGEKIIRYGQTIGYAKTDIEQGEWVHDLKITMPTPPDLQSIPLSGYTSDTT